MKKSVQNFINTICKECYQDMCDELFGSGDVYPATKLRSCQAVVFDTENYYVLRSYMTIVAFIDKNTDVLYDVLRYTFGYTPTSAKHISKFEKDYCAGKWSCADRLTYRDI